MNKIIMRYIFIVMVALATGCGTGISGLGNSTRSFTHWLKMHPRDWADSLEMDRTWQAALVRIPKTGSTRFIRTTIGKLTSSNTAIKGTYPTVIYMHGCTGIWEGTLHTINFLAKNGYAVIAPASFARKKYPKSCEPSTHKGGLYQPTLKMRQNDAGYAIAKAKMLDWVDSENVFLMGLSEGGITTATFSSKDEDMSVKARIVEGWTCHAGWHSYHGLNAPDNEPVLSLVAKDDPWFQSRQLKGDCGRFMNKSNGSKSIVFADGYLRYQHRLLGSKKAKKIVIRFLKQNIN